MRTALAAMLLAILLPAPQVRAAIAGPRKTAVLDVHATGAVDPRAVEGLSALLASEVTARDAGRQVISGADIRAMVGFEKQRALLGCTEASCLAEIGGALGVDDILVSEVSTVGGVWLLSMSLVDIGAARTVARLTRRAPDARELLDASGPAVADLLDGKAPAPSPLPPQVLSPSPPAPRSELPRWVALGSGILAAGVGGALLAHGYALHDELAAGTQPGSPTLDAQQVDELRSSGELQSRLGVGLLAGGAALALGSFLLAGGSAQ